MPHPITRRGNNDYEESRIDDVSYGGLYLSGLLSG